MGRKLSEKKQISIKSIELIKKADPIDYLSEIRLTTNSEHYSDVLDQLSQFPVSVTQLLTSGTKKSYENLAGSHLAFLNLEIEYTWAKNIISRHQDYLNKFIRLAKDYSTCLLSNNFDLAGNILNSIEEDFGQSIWLIKNKIAFLQLTEGLETQKQYSQNVKDELPNGSLIRFVIHWISVRNESQTSSQKLYSQVESIINQFHPVRQLGYKEYCLHHILAEDPTNPEEFAQILRLEYSRSLIDYYEAFLALSRIILLSDNEKIKGKVKHTICNEKFVIEDVRMTILKAFYSDSAYSLQVASDSVNGFELFLEGNYGAAIDLAESGLMIYPDDISLMYLLAISKSMMGLDIVQEDNTPITLRSLIVNNFSSVFRHGLNGASKEFNELSKLTMNFSSFHWASFINIILKKETTIFSELPEECQSLALKLPWFTTIYSTLNLFH